MPAVATLFVVAAAEITATMVFAAVAQAGIGLSIVGRVTGNQNLARIGGVMALAGGIGSFATGAAAGAEGLAAEGLATEAADTGMMAAEAGMPQAAIEGAVTTPLADQLPINEQPLPAVDTAVNPGGLDGALGDTGLMNANLAPPPPVTGAVPGGALPAPNVAAPGVAAPVPGVSAAPPPPSVRGVTGVTEADLAMEGYQPGSYTFNASGGLENFTAGNVRAAVNNPGFMDWFNKLDNNSKAHVATAAAQIGAGLFQGLEATKRFEIEQAFRQAKYTTEMRNASYAPKLGLISARA